jgi:hypothetical protein
MKSIQEFVYFFSATDREKRRLNIEIEFGTRRYTTGAEVATVK